MSHELELQNLCQQYGAELPEKIAAIRNDWHHLKQQDEQALFSEMIRKIHSLVGAGATFGYATLSVEAAKLELELRRIQEQALGSVASLDKLESLFKAVESAAQLPSEHDISTDGWYSNKLADTDKVQLLSVLLISRNQTFTSDVSNRLKTFEISCHVLVSADTLLQAIKLNNPGCIVVDLVSLDDQSHDIELIKNNMQELSETPALVAISGHHDMAIHLSAVRAGASAYFFAPLNILELMTYIRSKCNSIDEPPYRILIVDDDQQFAHHTALLLQRAGMDTSVLNNPFEILEPLASFQPEVILLDLYMPDCNGIELATIIRQRCIYAGITIVFFSVETDIERHIDALVTGGDDFFVKSMPARQLIARVIAKAKHARVLQSLMLHDSLTGLLNRSHLDESINRQMAISQRNGSLFSYVILDLDHFKHVNDQYGHQTGDEVLKSLAELALKRFRSVDSVIRYGGEELVVLLPDTSAEQAKVILTALLLKFSALTFTSAKQSFSVSFSAGIAQYPEYPDSRTLAEAADKALYQAKEAGRNQVCLA